MFKSLCLFLAAALLIAMIPCAALAEEDTHVVILATSDLHGNIWGYSYEDNAESSNNGMARLYTYIRQVREENPIVFLVDAGDDIQGTIMTDDIANKQPDSEHPVIAAMNYMGYDAMTLGNHEFNWGIKALNLAEGKRDWESSNSIRDMIVEYFAKHSPVSPTVDDNWRITGVDLSEDDPRRAEIIGYINEGLLPTPYDKSNNLGDYDALVAEAQANRAAGDTVEAHESH